MLKTNLSTYNGILRRNIRIAKQILSHLNWQNHTIKIASKINKIIDILN